MRIPANEKEWKNLYVVFATSKGKVKKNSLEDFASVQSTGKIAMKLDSDDKIIGVEICSDDQDIILSTKKGQSLRFMSQKLRLFKGRSSKGIKGIELSKDDQVIDLTLVESIDMNPKTVKKLLKNGSSNKDKAAELLAKQKYILSITENGFGKKTSFYDFNVKGRGGKGVKGIDTSERNGNVVAAFSVYEGDEVMLSTSKGRVIRCPVKQIRITGRAAKGTTIIRTSNEEKVVTAFKIIEDIS